MNYYEILEVSINASQEVIKNAYRALIKKYHPDSYTGNKQYAEEMIKKINEAYETLSDENKRLLYDYDEGFKIDPNASVDEVVEDNIVPKEENVKDNKDNKNKEFKIEEFIKNHKILVVISVVVIFILAFLIGNAIAGKQEKEEKQDVKQENKVENEKENTQNNKYSPNYEYKYNNEEKQTNDTQTNINNSNLSQNNEVIDNNQTNEKEENNTDINPGIS